MKRILLLVFLLRSLWVCGQNVPLKTLRYDEDHSATLPDTTANFYRDIKFRSLSKDRQTYISFGGDVRFQYYHVFNDEWGEQPDKNYGYVFSRYLGHADFHAGKYFRAFLELQSGMANAKASTSPADENPLDLHQAFVDLHLTPGKTAHLTLRVGRQELFYGSQRLISVREGPNNRHSFDGLKAIFSKPNQQLDFFYTHYVASKKGVFDDGFNKNMKLWGIYSVSKNLPFIKNADLYYLGIDKTVAVYDAGAGKEIRHSVGTRIWGKSEHWRYDLEGVYQFGDFAKKKISAWTASAHIDYLLTNMKFKPEIGLKTEIISGDSHDSDNKLGTFNPLFPRGGYFGLAALVGPANLIDTHPSLNFYFTEKLSLDLDYDLFWRYSTRDGVYGPNAAMIYSGKDAHARFIGTQYSADMGYEVSRYLSFAGEFTWFKAGQFLKEVGPGKNIFFICVTAELKF